MKFFALAAIRLYQRFISPYKGFSCAYRGCTGRASCSTLGYRAIRRHGVRKGLLVLRGRMRACGEAYDGLLARRAALHAQAGFLDCDCGGCGDISMPDADCCDCADCDFPSRKKKRQNQAGGS